MASISALRVADNPEREHHKRNVEAIFNTNADVEVEANGLIVFKLGRIRKYTDREEVLDCLIENPTATASFLNTDTVRRERCHGFIPWPELLAAQTAAPLAKVVYPAPVETADDAPAVGGEETVTTAEQLPADIQAGDDAAADAEDDDDDGSGIGDVGDEPPQDAPNAPGEPIEENISLIEARLRSNKQRQAVLAEFNERYVVVNDGGRALIFSDEYDPVLRRKHYSRMKPADLKLLYQNRSVCSQVREKEDGKPEPKYEKVADYWLKHKERRQRLGGVIFDPSGNVNNSDVLNLWRGFSFEPKQGSWRLLKDHIRVVLCQNNKTYFDYLMGWMARLVKLPAKQGEVAVVLRGELGTGKGTLAHALRALFHHQHAMHISSSKHLVGNFNLHLRDCILLFADEAFYAGDKASLGVLKSIITEPVLAIEGKYQNAVQTPNYLHIIMASNNEWVVPAGFGERRFFVLDVSNEHKQDKPYFAAIKNELESGGYAAMLYDLMHYDLRKYEVRDVPETKALQDQKKQSLESKHGWWREVLSRGYVFRSKLGLEDYFGEWHEFAATSLLYDSYREFSKEAGERHPLSREMLGRFIRELGCRPGRPDHQVVGEHLIPGGAALIRKRRPGYQLGNLNDARDAFERITGLTMEWDDVD